MEWNLVFIGATYLLTLAAMFSIGSSHEKLKQIKKRGKILDTIGQPREELKEDATPADRTTRLVEVAKEAGKLEVLGELAGFNSPEEPAEEEKE